jgi:poly(A) polymerase
MNPPAPLEPAATLTPQPWMTAPETRAVLAALTQEGAVVRFVGGCVRDAVLGRPVHDIDIATHQSPHIVMRLLEAAGIRAVPTGLKHGTVTAVVGKLHFEITTLRVDVETYGRHAKVEFTDDWRGDAARRDLTMNSLFLDADGALYDPFGGLEDLREGRVRFVGKAARRIKEDVLRLLRFFRFYAHYGTPPPDAEGLAACRELAHLLPNLSGERVAGELLRLLDAPDPAGVLDLMEREGVLAQLLPEARRIERLRALVAIETGESIAPHPLRRLGAALGTDKAGVRTVATRLRFSNAERERLLAQVEEAAAPAAADEKGLRRLLYRLGPEAVRDRVLLYWAGEKAAGGGTDEAAHRRYLVVIEEWLPVKLPLRGADAIALGVAKGPEVGRLLGCVERWWIDGDFQAGREACLAKLRDLIAAPGRGP